MGLLPPLPEGNEDGLEDARQRDGDETAQQAYPQQLHTGKERQDGHNRMYFHRIPQKQQHRLWLGLGLERVWP